MWDCYLLLVWTQGLSLLLCTQLVGTSDVGEADVGCAGVMLVRLCRDGNNDQVVMLGSNSRWWQCCVRPLFSMYGATSLPVLPHHQLLGTLV